MSAEIIKEFLGKTLVGVKVNDDNDEILFDFGEEKYKMYHGQD